jgi:hypothetical protein
MLPTPTVPIRAGLAEAIDNCHATVAASVAQCALVNKTIDEECAKLIAVREEINEGAAALLEQAALDADAATFYVTNQTRLCSIATRLHDLEKQRVSPDYSSVHPVVELVIKHWLEHLPGVIACYLESAWICAPGRGHVLVPLTDAVVALSTIRRMVSTRFQLGFRHAHYVEVQKIFTRALRGQIHLLFDPPVTAAIANLS